MAGAKCLKKIIFYFFVFTTRYKFNEYAYGEKRTHLYIQTEPVILQQNDLIYLHNIASEVLEFFVW